MSIKQIVPDACGDIDDKRPRVLVAVGVGYESDVGLGQQTSERQAGGMIHRVTPMKKLHDPAHLAKTVGTAYASTG